MSPRFAVLASFSLCLASWAFAEADPATPKGRTFYVDPAKGAPENDGSAAAPWRTIEEVIQKGLIRTRSADGKVGRANAPVQPGDTLLLRTGPHGEIKLAGSYNEQFITIAAEPGQRPIVSRVEIRDGAKWIIRGLSITPEGSAKPHKGDLVVFAEGGPSEELVLEDCFLYTALDSSKWTAKDWTDNANNGIFLGRHGTKLVARNNHVFNTRFGIALCSPESLCEGNLVENFSGDGIRVTRDDLTVQYNVIKNIYVSDADGDSNHDDGIQVFLFNKGTGTVRRDTIRGNLIITREDPNQPFPAVMQGIGCFDGPLVDFLVEDNVVLVSHWHGISLYDAQNCTIRNNAVFTKWMEVRLRPWIMLGNKQKLAKGNKVEHNIACSFDFKSDAEVKAEDNRPATEEEFNRKKHDLEVVIATKFGRTHPVSGRVRVEAQPEAAPAAVAAEPKKTVAAAPPKPPALVCRPEALKEWQERLRTRTQTVVAAGRHPKFELSSLKTVVAVQTMNEKGAMKIALDQGGQMDLTWAQLEGKDFLNLALALAAPDESPEDHALAGFFLLHAREAQRAEDQLAKAGDLGAAVRAAFQAEANSAAGPSAQLPARAPKR
jgi:parallel beta-helix repeat protein